MSTHGLKRLMVVIPDRISDILVKGEYQPNYYNPGEVFDEVHVVTTTDDRPDVEALQRTVGHARLFVENIPEDPSLIAQDWGRWWKKPLRDWARPGVELARRVRPQLIRCHGADWNGYLASRIKKALGVPYVLSMHTNPDVTPVRLFAQDVLTPEQERHNQFYEYVADASLHGADLVLPVYRAVLPYLSRKNVERVEVLYNILNGQHLRQKISYSRGDRFRIISVGRLIREKNPDQLLRSVADLADVDLTIVGDGPERANLERLARDLGISHRIEFRPAIQNDELCALLPEFDLFAVHTDCFELNKSVLEALLTGLPVVINRRTGPPVPELHGADIVCFADNTAESYRDAICGLMNDDVAREALGRRAFAHAEANWSPSRSEAKVVEVYRRLIGPGA